MLSPYVYRSCRQSCCKPLGTLQHILDQSGFSGVTPEEAAPGPWNVVKELTIKEFPKYVHGVVKAVPSPRLGPAARGAPLGKSQRKLIFLFLSARITPLF